MTVEQYKIHAEIMAQLRSRFLIYWQDVVLPALIDSEIYMTKKESARSMAECWRSWKNGDCPWFIEPLTEAEKN
jgi:hypothetical protein